MKAKTQPDEPAKRLQPGPDRGSPSTPSQALRKNGAVRAAVAETPTEPDELREHGYGHGV